MSKDNNEAIRGVVTRPAYILRSVMSGALLMIGVIAKFVPELFADVDAAISALVSANWLVLIIAGLALGIWNVTVLMQAVRRQGV